MASPTIFVYSADRSVQEISPSSPLAVTLTGAAGGGASDVNVVLLPDSIAGPGSPAIDSYQSAVVDLAASTANQVMIAAPGANKQLWIYGLFMMADTAAGTILLEDSGGTARTGTMAVSDEGGWVWPLSGNFSMPWLKVPTNLALRADTGACTVDGLICYAIVSV